MFYIAIVPCDGVAQPDCIKDHDRKQERIKLHHMADSDDSLKPVRQNFFERLF